MPTTVQMTVVNLSYMALVAMLNGYGVAVAAAGGIGLKINTFAGMPCWAVGQAMTTMAGQSMGAGLTDRAEETGKTGLRLNLLVTIIAVAVVQVFAVELVTLFAPADSEVIAAGVQYLRICCFWNSLVYAVMYSFDSFAIGVGSAYIAMADALLDAAFIRLPLCWVLSAFAMQGFEGIFLGAGAISHHSCAHRCGILLQQALDEEKDNWAGRLKRNRSDCQATKNRSLGSRFLMPKW